MKPTYLPILMVILCLSMILNARDNEKKPLTIHDFSSWKSINNQSISNNGKFVAFEINPQKGDGKLIVQSLDLKTADTLSRGFDARFSPNQILSSIKLNSRKTLSVVQKRKS